MASLNSRFVGTGLVPEVYDDIALSYSSGLLSIVIYYLKSVEICRLTLQYSGGNLSRVTRS